MNSTTIVPMFYCNNTSIFNYIYMSVVSFNFMLNDLLRVLSFQHWCYGSMLSWIVINYYYNINNNSSNMLQ